MQKFFAVIASFCLVACGGGGDDNTTSSNANAPRITPPSGALKDNRVAANVTFNQFESFLIQLPDRTSQFKGDAIYIKLYTRDGQTIYLGQYFPNVLLNLHIPNHVKYLLVDMFSTEPTDPQLTEEIVL